MILGIDPGLENTGWGVIDEDGVVEMGVIVTTRSQSSQERLGKIFKEIKAIIKKYQVSEVAIESLYFAKNAKSALKVAEAIGAIKIAAEELSVKVYEYTPLQIKIALVGYGRAEKEQVEVMVREELAIKDKIEVSHTADALAVALTHKFTSSFVRA